TCAPSPNSKPPGQRRHMLARSPQTSFHCSFLTLTGPPMEACSLCCSKPPPMSVAPSTENTSIGDFAGSPRPPSPLLETGADRDPVSRPMDAIPSDPIVFV